MTFLNKKSGFLLIFSMVIISAMFLIYTVTTDMGEKDLITYSLYDIDGKPIIKSFFGLSSIVGGTEGVYGMSFDINVKNIGEVPITVSIANAIPNQLLIALPTTQYTINGGDTKTITSEIISTTELETMAQPITFGVDISGEYTYGGITKQLPTKSGSMDVTINKDPIAGFEIDFGSSSGIYSFCIPGSTKVYDTYVQQCNVDGTSYETMTKYLSCFTPYGLNDYKTCTYWAGSIRTCDIYQLSTNSIYKTQVYDSSNPYGCWISAF